MTPIPPRPTDLPAGQWTEAALRVLRERYLLKDARGAVIETPEGLCWRVAWTVAQAERAWGADEAAVEALAQEFYGLMVRHEFLANSPTLMNCGTGNGLQYSACYVLPVRDSLDSIMGTLRDAAMVHRTGGGVGYSFSALRPEGTPVRTSGGRSSGPISFMKIYDTMTEHVRQGGRRRGANMGILRVDHPNVLDFIESKLTGGITNFNISVAVTDEFMAALEQDAEFPLRAQAGWPRPDGGNYQDGDPYLDPATGQVLTLHAREVWDRICRAAWATGDPGLFFVDRTNRNPANPLPDVYQISSTNPCVTGETLVATPEGWAPAEKLAPGDWILTPAGPRRLARVERSVHPIYRVRLSDGGEVRATAGHQFFARPAAEPGATARPIRLDQLGRGDVVRVLRRDHPTLPDGAGEGKILGITPDGVAEVYDLYEPTTDSWLPQGYLSRGCGEEPLPPYGVCVTEATRVRTELGLLRVDELEKAGARLVLTRDQHGLDRYAHLGAVLDNGVKPVLRITLDNGLWLDCTPEHLLFTPQGPQPAANLRPGDTVEIQQDFSFDIGPIDEVMECLGWIHGDGWFTDRAGVGISFNYKDGDGPVKGRLLPVFHRLFGQRKPLRDDAISYQEQNNAAHAMSMARAFGFVPRPAHTKRLPESFWAASPNQQRSFLHGLFGADATVSRRRPGQIRFYSNSPQLIDEVQLALASFGIHSSRHVTHFPEALGRRPQYRLLITKASARRFASRIGFAAPRKEAAFAPKQQYRDHPTLRVRSVTPLDPQRVFDLAVPETHRFYANSLLVHNCNLASLNLARFVAPSGQDVDWARLGHAARLGIRFLDNIIDINPFPLPEIRDLAHQERRVGLGVMGWADLLIDLGIPYDSDEAVALAAKLGDVLLREAWTASEALAETRGPFPLFPRSRYAEGPPRRNSTVTTIAPTGSISVLAGCSSGIEPLFAVAFTHDPHQAGNRRQLRFLNERFVELARARGILSDPLLDALARQGTLEGLEVPDDLRQLFKGAHEIPWRRHIEHQAAWQQAFSTTAVSKTCNLPHSATVEDVDRAYRLAWKLGCLGITVFRDGCKGDQVLTVGAAAPAEGHAPAPAMAPSTPAPDIPLVRPRPARLDGPTFKVETPLGTAYVTVTLLDGEPLEVFVNIGKSGTDTGAFAEALGRLVSTLLRLQRLPRRPDRAREVIDQLRQIGGSRDIGLGPHRIRSVPDAVAWALQQALQPAPDPRQLALPDPPSAPTADGPVPHPLRDLCPECGTAAVVYEEGCRHCLACGLYSEC